MAARVEPSPVAVAHRPPVSPLESDRHDCLQHLTAARHSGDAARLRRCEAVVVERFRPLADGIARRYRGRGIEDDDLVQLARLGLCKAVRRWRPELDPALTHFAGPTIEGEIKRYFRDHCRPIRMPRSIQEDLAVHQAAEADLLQRHGTAPSARDIAEASGTSVDRVRRQRLASRLCQPVTADADDGSAVARIRSDSASRAMIRVDEQYDLGVAVRSLSARERRILALRFVGELSQTDIAADLGVSQMQVSRLLRSMLTRLRVQLA